MTAKGPWSMLSWRWTALSSKMIWWMHCSTQRNYCRTHTFLMSQRSLSTGEEHSYIQVMKLREWDFWTKQWNQMHTIMIVTMQYRTREKHRIWRKKEMSTSSREIQWVLLISIFSACRLTHLTMLTMQLFTTIWLSVIISKLIHILLYRLSKQRRSRRGIKQFE